MRSFRCRTLLIALVAALPAALVSSYARADFLSTGEVARRACESALAAEEEGRPGASSRIACHQALVSAASAQDFRNEVASLMAGTSRPSLDDLVIATLNADAATHKATREPWGYLARCDIARKLGNADLMQSCIADMRRLAPGSALLGRAQQYAASRPSTLVVVLRLLLLVALAFTAVHALWRRRRRAVLAGVTVPRHPAAVLMMALASLSLLAARPARAEDMPGPNQAFSVFGIDDKDPESTVPTPEQREAAPLQFGYYLQDLAAKAEVAAKKGDHAQEARYFRALTKAVPDSAVGPRKLCAALQTAGDLKGAVVACRTAITRNGSNSADYLHFVQVVLSTPGPLPRDEHKELNAVLSHLEGQASLGALPWMFRCEVALRFSDRDELGTCTNQLGRLAPRDPKTVSFQWALAMQDNDRQAARQALDRARGLGMNGAGVTKMEQATRAMTMRWLGRMAIATLALLLIVGGSIVVLRRAARSRLAPPQLTPQP